MGRLPSLATHRRDGRAHRLPLLVACAAVVLLKCDKGADVTPPPPGARRVAVAARSNAPEVPKAAATSVAPKAKKGCVAGHPALGKTLPKGRLSLVGVDDEQGSEALPADGFVWVNLWAAWCGPCKEELPRLLSWSKKLRGKGVALQFAFVSLDDDARETRSFLKQQPADGLKSTYYLGEGATRSSFLEKLALEPSPSLPVHVIADHSVVRCVIEGGVDDDDYEWIARVFAGK